MGDIDKKIQQAIDAAISNIEVILQFDSDGDLEVALQHNGNEISASYIALDKRFKKLD